MSNQVYSFGLPCLRSKQIGYVISQGGVPSFLGLNFGRYLTATCAWTRDDSATGIPGGIDGQGAIISGTITQNYGTAVNPGSGPFYAGNTNPNCPIQFEYPFYGSSPPTGDPTQQWSVQDNTFTSVIEYYYPQLPGPRVVTCVVTLSNEYTVAQLQADGDYLLAQQLGPNPSGAVGWGEAFVAAFGEFPMPGIITTLADYNPAPNEFVAAYSGMGYTSIGTGGTYYPNAFTKVTGYVMMAGIYRQRTYFINFDSTHSLASDGGILCVNGIGSCGSELVVNPPPANPNQNSFVTLTPNCQCP